MTASISPCGGDAFELLPGGLITVCEGRDCVLLCVNCTKHQSNGGKCMDAAAMATTVAPDA
jgi:hypothetical protein